MLESLLMMINLLATPAIENIKENLIGDKIERHIKLKEELSSLKRKQVNNLYKILSSEKDDKYLLAAIAWQETNFGLNIINSKDGTHGSYCMFQIQAAVAAKRFNMKPEKAKEKLLKDFSFCKKAAREELEFWKNRKDSNFLNILARYNAGYKGLKSPAGKRYAHDVMARMGAIRAYVNEGNMMVD